MHDALLSKITSITSLSLTSLDIVADFYPQETTKYVDLAKVKPMVLKSFLKNTLLDLNDNTFQKSFLEMLS